MSTSMPTPTPSRETGPRDIWWLALVFGFLNLFALGGHPLANPDEGRYAEIPREMLATGDWITPRLDGVPYFEKPPLVYWLTAACEKFFGPGETSLRLVPAFFGFAGILISYGATRRIFGREAGLAAAVVLGTSLLYFGLSRLLVIDMVVSVLMVGALFAFLLGMRAPAGAERRRWLYLMYIAMALATLAKGLIGFFVTGAVMFFWLLICGQWKRLRPLYLPTGAVLFLAIAAPWHVLVAQRNPGWAHFYFIHEHWERFTTTGHGRYQPWWFFIPIVLAGLFPWVVFLWPSLREATRGGWRARRENADVWFLLVWIGFIFVFFSKSQSKLIPYILPIFPPLAALIGIWLARVWREATSFRLRLELNIFGFLAAVLAMAGVVAVLKPGIIRDPEELATIRPWAFPIAAVLLAGGVAVPWAAKVRGVRAALVTMAATTAGFLALVSLAVPGIRGTKPLAEFAREHIGPHDLVYHYQAFFHDFTYYAQRTVGLVSYQDELELAFLPEAERAARFIDDAELRREWAGPLRVWLVARRDDVGPLLAEPGFRYHLLDETSTHYLLSNRP